MELDKKAENLFIIFIFLSLVINPCLVSSDIISFSISPKYPVKGDIVEVKLHGEPENLINISLEYSKNLNISSGEFIWDLGYLEVYGIPNVFSITSYNLTLLRVTTIIMGVPITETTENVEGRTYISRRNIEPGIYWVQLSGEGSSEIESIRIEISASTIIQMDEEGFFSARYNTSMIPTGEFKISIGDQIETVSIRDPFDNDTIASNQKPIPIINHTKIPYPGEIIVFNATKSYDPDGVIEHYNWSLGDNSFKQGKVVEHTYELAGNYTVVLRVVDDKGQEASIASIINVVVKPSPVETDEKNQLFIKYTLLLFISILLIYIFVKSFHPIFIKA